MKAIIDKKTLEYLLECEAELLSLDHELTPSDFDNPEIDETSKKDNLLRPITFTEVGIQINHKVGDTIYFFSGSKLNKGVVRRIDICVHSDDTIRIEYIVPSRCTSVNQEHCSDKVRTLLDKIIKLEDGELCDNGNS